MFSWGTHAQLPCETQGPKATRSPLMRALMQTGDKSYLPALVGCDTHPLQPQPRPSSSPPSPSSPWLPTPSLSCGSLGVCSPAAIMVFSVLLVFAQVLHPSRTLWIFLTALLPACSYRQQCRSCPILALLPHQHEASLCPESPLSHMLLNCSCQIPASMQGGERSLTWGFSNLPTWPLPAPPMSRQITAHPHLSQGHDGPGYGPGKLLQ